MSEKKRPRPLETGSLEAAGGEPQGRREPIPRGSWLWFATAGGGALALGVSLLATVWFLQRPLAVLFLGLVIAAAVMPAVGWGERFLPRTVAIVGLYLTLALLLVLLGVIVFPTLVDQGERMAQRTPELANQAQRWLQRRFRVSNAAILDQLLSQVAGLGSTVVALPLEISKSIVDLVLVVFISLYVLIAAPDAHQFVLSVLPAQREEQVNKILGRLAGAMGGYVRGALIAGVIIGTLTYVGLLLIGVDFPLVLALLSGVFEFIPFMGPYISGAVIVIVAFLESPTKALIALAFVVGLQQLEGNLISPNVMHPQTGISPLTTLFAIFAGWTVGGVLGALIAVPLAAALRVLFIELVLPAVKRQTGVNPDERGRTD